MVFIYPPDCTDFSTNGLGTLTPYECTVTETAGGMYEIKLEHPIDDTLRWAQITAGCIVKAPVPLRESPLYEYEALQEATPQATTVTRKIYKVSTSGPRLRLRKGASQSAKVLGSYKNGTQVTKLGTKGSWMKVAIVKGGAVGYMWAANLTWFKDVQESVAELRSDQPVSRKAVSIEPSREQLFRLTSVETNTADGVVRAEGTHIFYDIKGDLLNGTYEPKGVAANTASLDRKSVV